MDKHSNFVFLTLRLGSMFNPTFYEVTQMLDQNNPFAGIVHILADSGLYLTQHFLVYHYKYQIIDDMKK